MAPKSGEKKPAKKVVKKTGAGATADKKKKVSRKAVESYKIYIYKVGWAWCIIIYLPAGGGLECDRRQALPTGTAWRADSAVQQLAQSRCSKPSELGFSLCSSCVACLAVRACSLSMLEGLRCQAGGQGGFG